MMVELYESAGVGRKICWATTASGMTGTRTSGYSDVGAGWKIILFVSVDFTAGEESVPRPRSGSLGEIWCKMAVA